MSKNIRVSTPFSLHLLGNGQASLFSPLIASMVCHVLFLVVFVFSPGLQSEKPPAPSVINVSMVSFKNASAPAKATPAVDNKAQKIEKSAKVSQTPVSSPVKKTAKVIDQQQPKPKTSLKKKTFKSTEVVKHAIKQLEQKTDDKTDGRKEEAASPEMLKSALERLRQEVKKAEAGKSAESGKADSGASGKTSGKIGKFNEDGKRTAELVDLYRLEVAFQIQKNWAFNEQLAGGDKSLVAAIVFKVMPDGEIRDIFFTDRSGNGYLDESAYKAIVKSSPVDSHPNGLKQAYVEMGIRFTPEGIR